MPIRKYELIFTATDRVSATLGRIEKGIDRILDKADRLNASLSRVNASNARLLQTPATRLPQTSPRGPQAASGRQLRPIQNLPNIPPNQAIALPEFNQGNFNLDAALAKYEQYQEKARQVQEKAAERARLASERAQEKTQKAAERARIVQERQAERARVVQERNAERARLAAEKAAQIEQRAQARAVALQERLAARQEQAREYAFNRAQKQLEAQQRREERERQRAVRRQELQRAQQRRSVVGASFGISNVGSSLGVVNNQISQALGGVFGLNEAFTGLGGAGVAASVGIAAALGAVTIALGAATAAAGLFTRQLISAGNAQLAQASAAIDAAAILNAPIEQTDALINKLTQTVAKNAAALPGATALYTELAASILQNVIPAATGLDGSLDEQALIAKTDRIAQLFGIMATRIGRSTADATNAANKALSGSLGTGELNTLDIFARNPLFKREIEEQLKLRGVTQLKELSDVERVELFEDIADKLLSPEAIARLSNTFLGKLETLNTQLFDDTVGIFGFNKELADRGNKKIIDAATSVLDEIIDIFSALAQVFGQQGFDADTVGEAIFDALTVTADYLNNLQRWIEQNQATILDVFNAVYEITDILLRISALITDFTYAPLKALLVVLKAIWPVLKPVLDVTANIIDSLLVVLEAFNDVLNGRITESIAKILSLGQPSKYDESARQQRPGQAQQQRSNSAFARAFSGVNLSGPVSSGGGSYSVSVSGARYSGAIPDSLLRFSQNERAFNPTGGRQYLVSENEYVFTPEQMKNFITNVEQNASQTFNINVQTMSEQQFAEMIVQTIKNEWTKARTGR